MLQTEQYIKTSLLKWRKYMKHIRTINKPVAKITNISYALSCKTSVTLGTNFNKEKRS